jgi:hypothetical protein
MNELGQRYPQHPEINSNTSRCICPYQSVYVDTATSVFSIPLRPVVIDRAALENCDDDKDNAIQNAENDCSQDDLLYRAPRKYPLVEVKKCKFQNGQLREVTDLDPVEVFPEFGNLIEIQCPDISTQTIRY